MSKKSLRRVGMVHESKEQIYAKHEIGTRVGFGRRAALLVIDLQKGYTERDSPRWGGTAVERVVSNTKRLVDQARNKGIPIIYVTIAFRKDLLDCGMLGEKTPGLRIFTEGSKWVQLDDAFELRNEDLFIVKKRPSAFFGTHLLGVLMNMGVDTLIVAGCNTSGCIRATVTDACSHGYRTIVPEECVGDRAEEPHESNLFDIDAKYADVMPLEEIMRHLRGL